MAGRPAGGKVTVTNDHIYDFPTSYDGRTPMPLLIALHAAGNPYTQLEGLSNGTRLETNFVRAFPKSAGSASGKAKPIHPTTAASSSATKTVPRHCLKKPRCGNRRSTSTPCRTTAQPSSKQRPASAPWTTRSAATNGSGK